MTGLRDYQQELYIKAREALKQYRSIGIQLHTGGGKTVIFTAMCESVYGKNKRAWIIVPRKELLRQSSEHLRRWKVPHGLIDANNNESRAYRIHVISKDTLIRRWDKIKNWPDLCVVDECHLNIDFQLKLKEHLPENTKILGYSATFERLDGKGLSTQSGGIYDILLEGPSIPWLTERGFLVPLRYFSPPLDGLDKIKVNRFGEYDAETLEELLQRKKVYGDLVSHWEKWGKNRSTLIFCRSIKSAQHAAERFQERGYNFVAIDGTMPDKKINNIIDAHRLGKIQGICNCLLVTYGVDIKRVEYIGDISPTESKSMYMQKIGRGLRPFEDQETGYKKKDLIYMDHVNQILTHQESAFPGIPIHYADYITWNFHGTEKRKRKKNDLNIRLCPLLDYFYCNKPSCRGCQHNPDDKVQDVRQSMVIIEADLKEIERPKGLTERPPEEQREYQDRINNAIIEYKTEEAPGPVEELLKIAEELGYAPLWVYWKLVDKERKSIHVPLLHEICRAKGYKPGWAWFKMKELKKKGYTDYEKKETREVMSG